MSKKKKKQSPPNIEQSNIPPMPPGKVEVFEEKPLLDKYCLKMFSEFDLFKPENPANIAILLNELYQEGWKLAEMVRECGECYVLMERIEDRK